MRSLAIAVVVVLAAPVATAAPEREESTARVSYSAADRPARPAPRSADGWVQLATPTTARHGTEFFVIGEEAGPLAQLRIEAASGKVIVERVKVYYTDGRTKTVESRRVLTSKRRGTVIALDGKPVDRVVVTTESYTRGTYALYGSSAAGGAAR
jgi:hypothetical protein